MNLIPRIRELTDTAYNASLKHTPEGDKESAEAVAGLNAIYEGKVFFEVNRLGLCARIDKSIDGLEHVPTSYEPMQMCSYIEQELPDGRCRIIKSRFHLDRGVVLYKSSLG